MMELLQWTGWNRNRKEVSQLLLPLQLVTGHQKIIISQRLVRQNIVSTLSIHRDTLTSQQKQNVHFVYQMVLLVYLMLRLVLNHSQKTYGVRLTHTMYLVWHSSTRWIKWVQISFIQFRQLLIVQERMLFLYRSQSVRKMISSD